MCLQELQEQFLELSGDQYGRRVLLYLLCPRSPRHFSPQFTALLTPGDGNAHSKKPTAVRRQELLEGVAASFMNMASGHIMTWAQNGHDASMLLEMIISLPGT